MMRPLTHDLADIIYLMLRQACPQALGRGDAHHQLSSLRQAFDTLNSTASTDEFFDIDIYSQDLSGFFTSISTERFLTSLNLMHKKGPRRASEHSQPSRPGTPPALREQILRIASETFDEMTDDPPPPQTPQPAPSTPPYPPPPAEEDEHTITNADSSKQNTNPQDLVDMINNLRHAMVDSGNKLESLFQKTTTVLVTQHETMTALISRCNQQLDIVKNLVRQDTPDWT
ncbi:hypothetical protein AK812_SmicGene4321 [Symbiodinium microadriaticum]|uniref:Uncharacterized protein n=1 Tax=Symbiodinium microadriaticum TaxID=2951 RepID=A0A1Q9EWQ1_SYMMI|nr:hypothetical protein AK812_SmicGene4321 [Symbiodinium microadriaticum]CAE7935546.1 unnamed protein product [Symbiodinium sp. KB8]